MKIKLTIEVILTLFLLSVLSVPLKVVPVMADPQASTTVFVDPPTIKAAAIGENIIVNLNVSSVANLYGWQAGVTFNPEVLNCTGYYEGEFLQRGADPELGTVWCNQTPPWDNTEGIVHFHGCCLLGQIPGVSGSGQLGYLTFEVIGTGVSDFHLTDVILVDTNVERIPHEVVDAFTVSWGGVNYSVETISNLTGIWGESSSSMFDHAFSPEEKTVTFNVTTPYDNFYQVTIPKTVLSCNNLTDWTVEVDGQPISFVATESPTATSLYFTHHNSSHKVEITGTVLGKPGDLNGDKIVNIVDIVIVAIAFGSKPEDSKWNPVADLNYDNLIDVADVVLVAVHYGETYDPEYSEVDLAYLASHMENFFGMSVKTRGIVKFYFSFYMYEDFWLQSQNGGAIPVVVRFAGLPTPPENCSIEILGTIEYCGLEGGFFYLNAEKVGIA